MADHDGDEAKRQTFLKLSREAKFRSAGVMKDDGRLKEAQVGLHTPDSREKKTW